MNKQELKDFWDANTENLEKLTLEEATFIFAQAEKCLADSIETAKKIYERCYSFLTIISAILISLVAYSIARWETNKTLDTLLITSIALTFYFLCLGLIFLLKNITPRDYQLPGTKPENYFNEFIFNDSLKKQERILKIYQVEIFNYSERININEKINEQRWHNYTLALKFLFFSPLVMGVVLLICIICNALIHYHYFF